MMRSFKVVGVVAVAAALGLVYCGGKKEEAPAPAVEAEVVEEVEEPEEVEPEEEVVEEAAPAPAPAAPRPAAAAPAPAPEPEPEPAAEETGRRSRLGDRIREAADQVDAAVEEAPAAGRRQRNTEAAPAPEPEPAAEGGRRQRN